MAKPSSKVKVVNPVWNGNGIIKRKVAEFYVTEGRAEWVGRPESFSGTLDQLRLIPSHPKNVAAAARAAEWWRENNPPAKEYHRAVKFRQPERRALPSKVFPDGEPMELRGRRLPHEKAQPIRPQSIREITHGALHSEFSVRWKPPLSGATIAKLQNPGASPFEKYRRE